MIKLTLPIEPVAWGRVKRGRFGQAYVPEKTARFESEAARLIKRAIGPSLPLEGPLFLVARFILSPPHRPKWKEPAVRPDLDNYLKAIKDAANGLLWFDDAQVVKVEARKLYAMDGTSACIELEVGRYE